MKTNKPNIILPLLVASFFMASGSAFASTSKELAAKGNIAWQAFSCHHIAIKAEDKDETERLLQVGYKRGKEFIEAVRKNQIEQGDIDEVVPSGVLECFDGPFVSPDFILGRIYQMTQSVALKDVYGEKSYWEYEDIVREAKAIAALNSRNASFLK